MTDDPYLTAIDNLAGPDGWTEVSTRQLAGEVGVHYSRVARALQRAVNTGALVVEKRAGMTPRYRLAGGATPPRNTPQHPATPERRGTPTDEGTPLKGGDPRSSSTPPEKPEKSATPQLRLVHNPDLRDDEISSPETAARWFARYREQLGR